MNKTSEYIFLVGRILYALPLIIMGSTYFMQLTSVMAGTESMSPLKVSVVVSGLVIIIGSVSILVGYRGKIGAWLVTVFLLVTAFILWDMSDATAMQSALINFFKNLVMAGAALMLTQTGTGPFSVDNLNKPKA